MANPPRKHIPGFNHYAARPGSSGVGLPPNRKIVQPPSGVACPKCGGPSVTIDSRPQVGSVKRRRACASDQCGQRFTTWETVGLHPKAEGTVLAQIVSVLRECADRIEQLAAATEDDDDDSPITLRAVK